MSHNDSTWEQVEASAGDSEGVPVGISEGYLYSLLSGTVDTLRRISTTPGPNIPSQGEQGSHDSPLRYPLTVLRGVAINLSEIISDSEVADPPGVAASMFKTSDTTPIEELAGGACDLPRTSRGKGPKIIKNNKYTSCARLKYKYQINYFQVTLIHQEDEYEDTSDCSEIDSKCFNIYNF